MSDVLTTTTERVAPVHIDSDGNVYQRLTHKEGLRNKEAMREVVGEGEESEVFFLVKIGTKLGSSAEAARLKQIADVAKTPAPPVEPKQEPPKPEAAPKAEQKPAHAEKKAVAKSG